MAWQIRGANTNTGTAETATVTKPTNTDGDGIAIVIRTGGGRTITPPSGFTERTSGTVALRVFTKAPAASEGTGSYSLTWTGQGNTTYAIAAVAFYEDSASSVLLDVAGSEGSSTATDHDLPAVTDAYPNSFLVGCIGATGGGSALTFSSAVMDERADVQNGTTVAAALYTATQAAAGDSGTKRVTSSISVAARYQLLSFYATPLRHTRLPLMGVG